ncbi:hypothetical protein AGMMS49936_11580 [Endomicrobiia bacterium]|nr:hypothetical protein AGMMS49936_11580 [Endomicrobiia bacterium]
MEQPRKGELQRKAKIGTYNLLFLFIVLGGSVGTGLFLGLSEAIVLAGSSVLIGYLISGIAIGEIFQLFCI